ncbi:MAG: UvrD-helicase domain-containing protein [bacterium]|nr:UvrD-helicase domain-containing protein [bacterium]MDZ4248330.1 UvrD-helicase domain-containing protein [Patescibacteria group bacterium]
MAPESNLLDELNENQRLAAETTDGPVLILAGAGSGKTRALTYRVAHLICDKQVPAASVLAVTFTNKAANEMKERVMKLLRRQVPERASRAAQERLGLPVIGTFHSVCVRILRRDGAQIGLAPGFTIYDAHDSQVAVKTAMDYLGISQKQYNPGFVRHEISAAKNELVDAAKYGELAQGEPQTTIAAIYREYQKLLKRNDALDFDDLLVEVVRLFSTRPEVLKKYQDTWRYVMVDEYQDTNHVQYQLTKLLAQGHGNLCVVGDPDQGIYSWRGADIRNILEFEKDYPAAKVVKLERNYRSTQNILDAAQAVIEKNTGRKEKALWTEAGPGEKLQVFEARNERDEADQIVREIRRLAAGSGDDSHRLRDVAVLYRTNAQSRAVEERLIAANLPYRVVGGVRFYERKEVKDVLAYLQALHNPNDTLAWKRIINVPTRGIGDKAVAVMLETADREGLSLKGVVERSEQLADLAPASRRAVVRFAGMHAKLRKLVEDGGTVDELITAMLKETGYAEWIDDGTVEAAARLENLKELSGAAKRYDHLKGEEGLSVFLEDVSLITDVDQYDQDADSVTLMTLHAAKGLEFPVVMIVGLEEGIFPHSRSLMDASEMEEERRLAYVGMTRAMKRLYLLHAASRVLYGTPQANLPSRFLSEIPEGLLDVSALSTGSRIADSRSRQGGWSLGGSSTPRAKEPYKHPSEAFSQEEVYLESGDTVSHPKFGKGTVKEVGDTILTVDFDDGTKKLSSAFAGMLKKE